MKINPDTEFTDLIASSVHDMKNSVGMILSSLEDIGESCDGEMTCQCSKEQIFLLQYEAKRVNRNLMQLLTLYRLGSGHYGLAIDEWMVNELLQEAFLLNKPLLTLHNINLAIDCPDDMRVYCDRSLILGLLDNIITNALRYSHGKLLVRAEESNNFVNICIEDDGAGYPNAMLEGIADNVTKIDFQTGSTGIGLYFSQKIAALHKNGDHKGTISIRNGGSLGGAVFEVKLPL
jgi:two-component system sensor histidine kinase SenX3